MAEYVDIVGGSDRTFVIAADNVAIRRDDGVLVPLATAGVPVGGGGGGASYDDTAIKARMTTAEGKITTTEGTVSTLGTNLTSLSTALAAGLEVTQLSRYASVWGDSRTNQNWSAATNPVVPCPLARSWLWWAEALSYGRVRMTNKYNFGVQGDTIAQVYARMTANTANAAGVTPNSVPAGPAILFVGTNSINAGLALTTAMNQVASCVDWLQARNHKVFIIAEWPRGIGTVESTTGLLTAANQKLMLAYNKALLTLQNTRKGLVVVNPWERMIDPTSTTASPLVGMVATDGLHNSPGNAYVTGKMLAQAFKDAGLKRSAYGMAGIDLWATNNPYGALNKNPTLLQGTGGTNPANNTGPVPQDWTFTLPTGITSTSSYVMTADNDGVVRPAWRLVLTGTTTGMGASAMLRQSALYNASSMATGDVMEGVTEYRVSSGFTNLASVGVSITDGSAPTASYGGLVLSGDPMIPSVAQESFQALAQTNEFTLGSTLAVNFELRVYLAEIGATSVTVDFFSGALRKRQLPAA
jgi:hypothetical protein